MKKFIFSQFIFLFSIICFVPLHAQSDFSSITKEQTLHIIDSITHSNNRTTRMYYQPDTVLYSQTAWLPSYGLVYGKLFYSNGKIMEEGLMTGTDFYDEHIGTWKYYDEAGKLFKEYDFSKKQRTLYGIQHEKYDWVFDSIPKVASSFLISAFGKKYFDEHIRIDSTISWYDGGVSYSNHYGTYPQMPLSRPIYLSITCNIIYNDTIRADYFSIKIDSNFSITEIYGIDSLKYFHPGYLKIDYNAAVVISKRKGFDNYLQLRWDDTKHKYYWETSYQLSYEGSDNYEEAKYRELKINAMTGATLISEQTNITNIDGFFSDYKTPVKDTSVVPPGWKATGEDGVHFNIPEDWYTTIIYRDNNDVYIFTNGTDSLVCENDGYIIGYEYSYYHLDTINANRFKRSFPDEKVNGRPMSIYIKKNSNGTSDILLSIYESGVGMMSSMRVYNFKANHLTMEQRDEVLEILKTVRFRYSN